MKLSRTVTTLFLVTACASSDYAGLAHHATTLPDPTLQVTANVVDVPDTTVTHYKDESGANLGTAETVTGYHSEITGFSLRRGKELIDEQDFYELAKDRDGYDAVSRARSRGMVMNRLGFALVIAGTAAAIAVPVAGAPSLAKSVAVGQWFVSFPIGLALAIVGEHKFSHPILKAARAFTAIGQTPPSWAARL